MADMKFSCSQCGQHISCDELWSGHQIQCPACQHNLTVPHLQLPLEAAAPDPKSLVPQPPASSGPKLSAGLTQVARSAPPSATPQRRLVARPPKTQNALLKYAIVAVVLAVIGVAAYNYLLVILSQVQEMGASKTPGPGAAPVSGGTGPIGEMNGTMDVSDALEGGSPSRPRAGAARPPVVVQPSATQTTNPAAKSANGPLRSRQGQPGPPGQAGGAH